MKKAVILLSGGLDSTTVLAMAKKQGYELHAMTVVYGQRHDVEIEAAKRVADAMGVSRYEIVEIPLHRFGGSALTADIEVPKDRDESQMQDIPATYVPARNTVLLSMALANAEVVGSSDIFVGVNALDYSGYPDCRPEFVDAFQKLARLATKAGLEGAEITIHAPLIHMSKRGIIEAGLALGVDYSLTHSCYDPVAGRACGHCDSCILRKRAFESLGMTDPALAHLVSQGG